MALIEIKTPTAELLGSRYRNAYPPSRELSGPLAQVLNYRRSLLNELPYLQSASPGLAVCNPSIFLLIGDMQSRSRSTTQQQSFELFRGSSRLSRLCCEVFPGQADDVDFFWCRLVRARCLKSGGDDDAAELAGHVSGRGLGLGGVPGSAGAMFADVGGVVAGGGIPAGRL